MWTSEGHGWNALTPLAWIGAHASTIRLGTAIMQVAARAPAATAMAALSMDHLSAGRFVLGLGLSGPALIREWYAQALVRMGHEDIVSRVSAPWTAASCKEAAAVIRTWLMEQLALIGPPCVAVPKRQPEEPLA